MKAPQVGFQALGLAFLVLAIFYPALHAPLNPMDDRAIVQWLYSVEGSNAWSILTRSTDYFYRPVLLFTYLLDLKLWGAETSFMHLGNVLLHVANTLLLFACARNVCNRFFPAANWPPFLAALLFAIHPVKVISWHVSLSCLQPCSFCGGSPPIAPFTHIFPCCRSCPDFLPRRRPCSLFRLPWSLSCQLTTDRRVWQSSGSWNG
jgi:hypothetical protein